ncbi:ubiquitin family protein [Ancylostoma caninum]|uniref:Ubiquitin family protein n=1 Tax=Ancylostoma caninum TaxID=29170 RepID=A0A368H4G5_ANCCA|nr:ubiquitin family protein [Ancylostoma caninum]
MSRSPEQKRDETSLSPKMSPTQGGSTTDSIEITVHSVMDGVKDVRNEQKRDGNFRPGRDDAFAKLSVPTNANVFELKRYICLATEVAPGRQLLLYKDKELRDDDASISSYGIVNSCSLTMNVKMNTGLQLEQKRLGAAEMFFLIPIIMPVGNLSNLRNTIRTMTDVNEQNSGQNPSTTDDNPSKWTPAKQMEHELTRNRMKKLLRKRRKTTILSNSSPPKSPGSVICRSPSEPASPGEPVEHVSSAHSLNTPESKELTEKELRVGFHWL